MEVLHTKTPWARDTPLWVLPLAGSSEILGAIEVILPAVTRIKQGSAAKCHRKTVNHFHEQIMFAAEGRIQARSVNAHAFGEIIQGSAFVPLRPKGSDGAVQNFVTVKFLRTARRPGRFFFILISKKQLTRNRYPYYCTDWF